MIDAIYLQEDLVKYFMEKYVYKCDLFEVVDEIRDCLHVKYPVDIDLFYDTLSDVIEVHTKKLNDDKFGGFIVKNKPPEKSHVCINSSCNYHTRIFAGVHEVLHWFCHPPGEAWCSRFGLQQYGGIHEYHANEGAAELLVPYKDFIPNVAKRTINIRSMDWEDLYILKEQLAHEYGVSSAVIRYRLESLKYPISQYVNGVDIDDVEILSNKDLVAQGIKVKSLNDIERQLEAEFDFRDVI